MCAELERATRSLDLLSSVDTLLEEDVDTLLEEGGLRQRIVLHGEGVAPSQERFELDMTCSIMAKDQSNGFVALTTTALKIIATRMSDYGMAASMYDHGHFKVNTEHLRDELNSLLAKLNLL
jgi:hypothetical protein